MFLSCATIPKTERISIPQVYTPPYYIDLANTTPEHIIRVTPPVIYEKWWGEILKCAKASSDIKRLYPNLKWNWVLADGFFVNGEGLYDGMIKAWSGEVWVAGQKIFDKKIVQHEMLHYIMWHQGKPNLDHPEPFNKCKVAV